MRRSRNFFGLIFFSIFIFCTCFVGNNAAVTASPSGVTQAPDAHHVRDRYTPVSSAAGHDIISLFNTLSEGKVSRILTMFESPSISNPKEDALLERVSSFFSYNKGMSHILAMFITLSALSIYSLVELWVDDKLQSMSASSSTKIAIAAAEAAISEEHNPLAVAIVLFAPFLSFWSPSPFLLEQFINIARDPLMPPHLHRIYFCMVCAACAPLYFLYCFLKSYMNDLLLDYLSFSFVSAVVGMQPALFKCLIHGRKHCFRLSILLLVSYCFQAFMFVISPLDKYTILENCGPLLILFLRRLKGALVLVSFAAVIISWLSMQLLNSKEYTIFPVVWCYAISFMLFLSLFFYPAAVRPTAAPLAFLYGGVVLHARHWGTLRIRERFRQVIGIKIAFAMRRGKTVEVRKKQNAISKHRGNRTSYNEVTEDDRLTGRSQTIDETEYLYMEIPKQADADA